MEPPISDVGTASSSTHLPSLLPSFPSENSVNTPRVINTAHGSFSQQPQQQPPPVLNRLSASGSTHKSPNRGMGLSMGAVEVMVRTVLEHGNAAAVLLSDVMEAYLPPRCHVDTHVTDDASITEIAKTISWLVDALPPGRRAPLVSALDQLSKDSSHLVNAAPNPNQPATNATLLLTPMNHSWTVLQNSTHSASEMSGTLTPDQTLRGAPGPLAPAIWVGSPVGALRKPSPHAGPAAVVPELHVESGSPRHSSSPSNSSFAAKLRGTVPSSSATAATVGVTVEHNRNIVELLPPTMPPLERANTATPGLLEPPSDLGAKRHGSGLFGGSRGSSTGDITSLLPLVGVPTVEHGTEGTISLSPGATQSPGAGTSHAERSSLMLSTGARRGVSAADFLFMLSSTTSQLGWAKGSSTSQRDAQLQHSLRLLELAVAARQMGGGSSGTTSLPKPPAFALPGSSPPSPGKGTGRNSESSYSPALQRERTVLRHSSDEESGDGLGSSASSSDGDALAGSPTGGGGTSPRSCAATVMASSSNQTPPTVMLFSNTAVIARDSAGVTDGVNGITFFEKLGEGRCGAVWLALDETSNRECAVKVIPRSLATLERSTHLVDDLGRRLPTVHALLKEVAALARLPPHPNICAIYECIDDADADRIFVVMQYCRGRSITGRPNGGQYTPLPPRTVKKIALHIATALAHCHEGGVVHGDVKPENILRSGLNREVDTNFVLADFGLAEFIAPLPAASVRSGSARSTESPSRSPASVSVRLSDGTEVPMWLNDSLHDSTADAMMPMYEQPPGTPAFLAPEVVLGRSKGPASDMWAMGVTLHVLLFGVMPFNAKNFAELATNIITSTPTTPLVLPSNSDAHALADRLLPRLLERDPEKRWTARRLMRALAKSS